MFVVFTLAFLGMGARLVNLQVVDATAYAQLAENQRLREIEFAARRGTLFDRDGEPLAISVDLQTIYADPALVEDPQGSAQLLAGPLEMPAARVEAKLRGSSPGSRFEYLARQAPPEIARAVEAMEIPGVYMQREAKRYYPNNSLGAHTIGFVDVDGKGLAGLELQYEKLLEGKPGRMTLEQDPSGRPLPQTDVEFERPEPGKSMFLTIDKDIQYFTEVSLRDAVDSFGAIGGSVVVMRPTTGEILALASWPQFDLNEPAEVPQDDRLNRALSGVYEPGSAFKIVTAAAALEEGVVTPKTKFEVPDSLPFAGHVIHDSHPHPTERMSMTRIITESSNVGTIKIAFELGGEQLDRYIREFGFGSASGLGFPTETTGIVIDPDEWSGLTIANLPIGQGVAVTPLQMAQAYATIANRGRWVEPKLVSATMDDRGKVKSARPPETRRVLSRSTGKAMVEILRGVVEEGGTGTRAQIPGFAVAGKTGTAQKALPSGQYGKSYVASFVGFAPAPRPEVVVAIVLDEPSPIWGGLTAAPTFQTIAEFALRHLGVRPTGNAARAAKTIESARSGAEPAHD